MGCLWFVVKFWAVVTGLGLLVAWAAGMDVTWGGVGIWALLVLASSWGAGLAHVTPDYGAQFTPEDHPRVPYLLEIRDRHVDG